MFHSGGDFMEKCRSRVLSVLLCVAVLLTSIPPVFASSAPAQNGSLGPNLIWTYDGGGTLTISGEGEMTDFSGNGDETIPWFSFRHEILTVVVDEGVTSIGNHALHNLNNAGSVVLPSTLKSIGTHSLSYLSSLEELELPEGMECLGDCAFDSCPKLDLTIRAPYTEFGYQPFGFYWNNDAGQYGLISGVTLSGLTGSSAEAYANTHGISFRSIGEAAVETVKSGKLGPNLDWAFDTTGTLTISGEGKMEDFASTNDPTVPWYTFRSAISRVVVEEGVTSIGDYALHGLGNVTEVSLPSTLTSIGTHGMSYMTALTQLTLPHGMKTLGATALGNCMGLNLTVYSPDVEYVYKSFGFYWDNQDLLIDGVTLYGLSGSTSQTYAQETGVRFEAIDLTSVSGSYRLTEDDLRTDVRGTTHIYTEEDLRKIGENLAGHYVLEADISLSGGWDVPLGTFSGTFDGNGHTISGLSVSQSDSGHYGLFATLSGVVTDLTLSGAAISANGGEWIAAGILAGELSGAYIQNCTVSGTVSAQGAPTLYAGGLAGTTNNGNDSCNIERCSSTVTITADAAASTNYAFAGGLVADDAAGVSDCTVEAGITLTQSGSNPNLTAEVYGVSGAASSPCTNCTVSGELTMNTIDGEKLLVTGLYQAFNSTNECTVSATAQTGKPFAAGGANVSNCTNNGTITVTASGKTDSAFACGLYAAEGGTNNGAVSSTAVNGSPTATGVDKATGNGVTNSGAISASGGENAVATGIAVAGYGELTSPVNNAQVQATSGFKAAAYGLNGGRYGVNNGAVTATSTDPSAVERENGIHSVAFAVGVYGGTYSENRGAITGKGGYTAEGMGCRNCTESQNSAPISADGNYISDAYGLENCTGSFNTGDTRAVTEGGGLGSSASSYGHFRSTNCSSTALAYAYNDHFLFEYNAAGEDYNYHYESGGVNVGGSTSIHASCPGFYDIQQSGDQTKHYFIWFTNGGPLSPPRSEAPTNKDAEAGIIGYCHQTFTTEGEPADSWAPEEPDDPPAVGELTVTGASFHYKRSDDSLITHIRNACGSFSFENGMEIDIQNPYTTDYRTVVLKLTVANRSSAAASDTLTVKLPDGFSFSLTDLQDTQALAIPSLQPGEVHEEWIVVYPIYSLNYEGTTKLRCGVSSANGSFVSVAMPCVVEQMGEKPDYAKVPYTSEKGMINTQTIHHFKYYHWDPSVFEQESHLYNLSVNQLAALFSQIIYEGKSSKTNRIYMDALAALGFSCVETSGTLDDPNTTLHVVAQKTYLDSEGNVQQLIVTSALGTVNGWGWLGNISFNEYSGSHNNFKTVAEKVTSTLNAYIHTFQSVTTPKHIITGHSRGAAVANLVAHQMNVTYADQVDSIYSYTYATPRTIDAGSATPDKNIFNIVYYNDLVGYVPGCFETYGNTWVFGHETADTLYTQYIIRARHLTGLGLVNPINLFAYLPTTLLWVLPQVGDVVNNHLMFCAYIDPVWSMDLSDCITMESALLQMDSTYSPEFENYDVLRLSDRPNPTDVSINCSSDTSYLSGLESDLNTMAGSLPDFSQNDIQMTLSYNKDAALHTNCFQVNCPVDVVVYDADGAKIAEIKDDDILGGSEYLTLTVVGDHKTLWFQQDGDFTFEITGYREGAMDCQFLAHDEEGSPTGAQNYYQLPVSPTETITAVYRDGAFSLADDDSQTITPDRTLSGEELGTVTLSFNCEGQSAVALGDGSYTVGQYATIIALGTGEDQAFLGWYNGDQLVSTQTIATIPCTESMTLTPKFGSPQEVPDGILSAVWTKTGVAVSLQNSAGDLLVAAAYSSDDQMLWLGTDHSKVGTVYFTIPEEIRSDAARVVLYLLDQDTHIPICAAKKMIN